MGDVEAEDGEGDVEARVAPPLGEPPLPPALPPPFPDGELLEVGAAAETRAALAGAAAPPSAKGTAVAPRVLAVAAGSTKKTLVTAESGEVWLENLATSFRKSFRTEHETDPSDVSRTVFEPAAITVRPDGASGLREFAKEPRVEACGIWRST
jgi:hypothetical protein